MPPLAQRLRYATQAELEAWVREDAATLRQLHATAELARRAGADPSLLGAAIKAILPNLGAASRIGGLPTGYFGAKVLHDHPVGRPALLTGLLGVPPLERYDLVHWLHPQRVTVDVEATLRDLEEEEAAMPEGDVVTRVRAMFGRALDVIEAVEPARVPPAGANLLFTLALRLWHTYTPVPEALLARADLVVRIHWDPAREEEAHALLGVAATLALPLLGELASAPALRDASTELRNAVEVALARWRCGDPWASLRDG